MGLWLRWVVSTAVVTIAMGMMDHANIRQVEDLTGFGQVSIYDKNTITVVSELPVVVKAKEPFQIQHLLTGQSFRFRDAGSVTGNARLSPGTWIVDSPSTVTMYYNSGPNPVKVSAGPEGQRGEGNDWGDYFLYWFLFTLITSVVAAMIVAM